MHEQILARSTDATQRAIASASTRTAAFEFVGAGHVTAADAFLAAAAAARAREHRRLAREESAPGLKGNSTDPRRFAMSDHDQPRAAAIPRMLLTRNEAAAALGMSLSHFQRHVQPHVRCVYSGQLRLFRQRDLERWADREACERGQAAA